MNYTFLLQLEDTTNWKDFISSNKFPFNSFPKNYFLRCFSSDSFLFSHYPRKRLLILEPKEPKIRRVHWESSVKINRGPSSIVSIPSGEFRDTNSRVQLERTLISRLYLISPSFLQIYFSTSTLSRINLEFLNCLKLISITRSRERHLLFVLAPRKITKVHSEV